MTSDTSEKGLESLIVAWMTGQAEATPPSGGIHEGRATLAGEWNLGEARDYNRESAVDLIQISAFLRSSQPTSEASRGSN